MEPSLQNSLRIILAAVLFALAGLYLHSSSQETYFEEKALPQLEQILTEISLWEEDSFRKHLSPQTAKAINAFQMQKLLDQYRPLGKFQRTHTLKFSKLMSAMSVFGDKRISYQGIVEFDVGLRDITITLIQQSDSFLIYNLNIKLDGL